MPKKSLGNRRDYTRLDSNAKVLVKLPNGESVLGHLTDLGLGGVGLKIPEQVALADRLELLAVVEPTPTPAPFRVVWTRSDADGWSLSGLACEGSVTEFLQSWVCRLFARAGGLSDRLLERRRYRRMSVTLGAYARSMDNRQAPCQLLNLSRGGLLMVSEGDWPLGSYVQVRTRNPELGLSGVVVDRRQAGPEVYYSMSFEPESPGPELDSLLAALDQDQEADGGS